MLIVCVEISTSFLSKLKLNHSIDFYVQAHVGHMIDLNFFFFNTSKTILIVNFHHEYWANFDAFGKYSVDLLLRK